MTEKRLLVGTVILLVVALVGAIVAGCFFVIHGRPNGQRTEDIKKQRNEQMMTWDIKVAADNATLMEITDDLRVFYEVPGEEGLGGDFHINKSFTKAYNLVYFVPVVKSSKSFEPDRSAQVKRATIMTFCLSNTDRWNANNWKAKIVKIDDYSGSWESLKDIGSAGYSKYLGLGTEYEVEYGEVFPWNDHHSQEVQTPDNPPLPPPPPPPSVPRCYK